MQSQPEPIPSEGQNRIKREWHTSHHALLPVRRLQSRCFGKFGLCSELDDAAYDAPARHRVHNAASRWVKGAVLDATVSTMVMIVGGGAFSSSAIKSFCAYAGAGIMLGWTTQVRAEAWQCRKPMANLTNRTD